MALRRRKDLQPLLSFLTRSHAEIITERFDTPLLRAALASMPPFCWMTQDGSRAPVEPDGQLPGQSRQENKDVRSS